MKKATNIFLLILLIANVYIWQNFLVLKSITGELEIYVLDIGQGDSILVKTPNNRYGLIDGGKSSEVLTKLNENMPFLVKEFEFIVFTHPDSDHIQGLNYVLENYKVNNVFIEEDEKESDIYEETKRLIAEKKINNYQITKDNDFELDGIYFDVVWPSDLTSIVNEPESNNSSIAIVINYKDFDFFTAGDLNDTNEEFAAKEYIDKEIDILKVSHHGSSTSTNSQLLQDLLPKAAIISVGRDNNYGHPSSDVLDRLKTLNIDVFRTDLEGTVRIEVSDQNFTINTTKTIEKYYN